MTHKQNCIAYCMDYLENKNLSDFFSTALFEHYYRKHNGSQANPYTFGLSVADFIIHNTKTA